MPTLGRGEIWFAPFIGATQVSGGERYFGNSPEFSLTSNVTQLDHFSSDRGVKEKDGAVTLQTERSGSFKTDQVDANNLALFFLGSTSTVSITGSTTTDEQINGVVKGLTYQLGKTATNPTGARDLDDHTVGPPLKKVIVKDDTSPTPVTFTEGADYTIDKDLGRLTILASGTITTGANLRVSYKTKTGTRDRVISGNDPIEGLLRYLAYNPAGKNIDYTMPWVKLTPNGDFQLKGDTWQEIPFNVEILTLPGLEAIYCDGRAFT